jgi:hypothetical protein
VIRSEFSVAVSAVCVAQNNFSKAVFVVEHVVFSAGKQPEQASGVSQEAAASGCGEPRASGCGAAAGTEPARPKTPHPCWSPR